MRHSVEQAFLAFLILVHGVLAVLGFAGLVELLIPEPAWPRISNPLFPAPILLLQWLLMLVAGVSFTALYAMRSRFLPWAMSVIYGAMALLCIVQTTVYLEHATRFRSLYLELAVYVLILVLLFRSPHLKQRLGT